MKVYVISGFLGAGKTKAILSLEKRLSFSKLHLIYMEKGKSAYTTDFQKKCASFQFCEDELALERHLEFLKAEEKDKEAVVWIEYNGTYAPETLFSLLQKQAGFSLQAWIVVTNEQQMQYVFSDLSTYMLPHFYHSTAVLYLEKNGIDAEKNEPATRSSQNLAKEIQKLCRHKKIYALSSKEAEKIFLQERTSATVRMLYAGAGLWALFLLWAYLQLPLADTVRPFLQNFTQAFLSLCLQLIPFLLLSAVLSSFLQLFVQDGFFQKISQHSLFALPFTLLSSFFLPICDCGLIPIWTRLCKKGVRFEIGLFLFMTSCVFNPLVLASTYFAYPEQSAMVIYRGVIGLVLALLAYLVCSFLFERQENQSFSQKIKELYCEASLQQGSFGKESSKFSLFVSHFVNEFYLLCKAVVGGIAFSTLVHLLLEQKALTWLSQHSAGSYVFLALALVFMGVCASANAFLSKNFMLVLPPKFLLIYMLFSPYLDLKNLLLMREGFGKKTFATYLKVILAFCVLSVLLFSVLPSNYFPVLWQNFIG